jgi:hypothetical protein
LPDKQNGVLIDDNLSHEGQMMANCLGSGRGTFTNH